eukprot:COSAG06_NODE_4027_length_4645_cov_2.647602_4_plen_51_part_00
MTRVRRCAAAKRVCVSARLRRNPKLGGLCLPPDGTWGWAYEQSQFIQLPD